MSVMGSQLEIDLDPEGSETVVPRHTGQTGTGGGAARSKMAQVEAAMGCC